jgi:hypothetical protein
LQNTVAVKGADIILTTVMGYTGLIIVKRSTWLTLSLSDL